MFLYAFYNDIIMFYNKNTIARTQKYTVYRKVKISYHKNIFIEWENARNFNENSNKKFKYWIRVF